MGKSKNAANKERLAALRNLSKFIRHESGHRVQLPGYEQAQKRVDEAFVALRTATIFDVIKTKSDGPIKKFELCKVFGKAFKERGVDPTKLSCAQLVAFLEGFES